MSTVEWAARNELLTDVDDLMSARPEALGGRWRIYSRLRAEEPCYRHERDQFLSRYADCRALLTDCLGQRRRESPGLSRSASESLRHRIEFELERRFDDLAARGVAEIIHDFADPLPMTVIGAVLDVPRSLRASIHLCRLSLARLIASPPERAVAGAAEARARVWALEADLERFTAEQRATGKPHLLRPLLAPRCDEGSSILEPDVVGVLVQLITTWQQAAQDAIGNALYALLSNREQWESLCANPALITNAVEEVLRHMTPTQLVRCVPNADVVISGRLVAAGTTVTCVLGSANRDEAVFEDPDRFDIARPNAKQHLAFPLCSHACLGAALTRMEVAGFLAAFSRRFPQARLANAQVEWVQNASLLSLKALPVRLGKDRG